MPKLSIFVLLFAIPVSAFAQQANEQAINKNVARSFFEDVLGQGRLDKYSQSHAADFVAHGSDHDYTLDQDVAAAREERKALPDIRMTVNQMIAENDLVAVHWTASGTNTRAGMGLPATGKKIKVSGITIFRFKAGKISEEWSAWDMLSVLKQAGLFPSEP